MANPWVVWLVFSAGSDSPPPPPPLPGRTLSGTQNIAHSVRTAGAFQRIKLADSEVGNSFYHTQRLQMHGTVLQIPNTWLLISNQINL
jgi:hypothetical protein